MIGSKWYSGLAVPIIVASMFYPHRADPIAIARQPVKVTVVSTAKLERHLWHLRHLHHLAHLLHLHTIALENERIAEERQITARTTSAQETDSPHQTGSAQANPPPQVSGGSLGCSGLESLWIAAGGNPGVSRVAADIAMAESRGQQYATGHVGERGYWQINPVNGPVLSTYNAFGNARAAVIMSGNGTNWGPWTTYTSGAYASQGC